MRKTIQSIQESGIIPLLKIGDIIQMNGKTTLQGMPNRSKWTVSDIYISTSLAYKGQSMYRLVSGGKGAKAQGHSVSNVDSYVSRSPDTYPRIDVIGSDQKMIDDKDPQKEIKQSLAQSLDLVNQRRQAVKQSMKGQW